MAKRGTDHTWKLEQYLGNGAIYAKCKCQYYYNCGRGKLMPDGSRMDLIQVPTVFYPYCPQCGARKKRVTKDIEIIDKYGIRDKD